MSGNYRVYVQSSIVRCSYPDVVAVAELPQIGLALKLRNDSRAQSSESSRGNHAKRRSHNLVKRLEQIA